MNKREGITNDIKTKKVTILLTTYINIFENMSKMNNFLEITSKPSSRHKKL